MVRVLVREELVLLLPADLEAVLHRSGKALVGLHEVAPTGAPLGVPVVDQLGVLLFDLDAHLFPNLTDERLNGRLAWVDLASDEAPVIVFVTTRDREDLPVDIQDQGYDSERCFHTPIYTETEGFDYRFRCTKGMSTEEKEWALGDRAISVGSAANPDNPKDITWVAIKTYVILAKKKDGILYWRFESRGVPSPPSSWEKAVKAAKARALREGLPYVEHLSNLHKVKPKNTHKKKRSAASPLYHNHSRFIRLRGEDIV